MSHRHNNAVVSIDHIVHMLNEILAIDPVAVSELGRLSVPCNRKLAEHSTVQVRATAGKHDYRVGLLGILNGVLSKSSPGVIQAIVDDGDNNKLLRFKVSPVGKAARPKQHRSQASMTLSNLKITAVELGGTVVMAETK